MAGGDPAVLHPSAPALVRGRLLDRLGRCRRPEYQSQERAWSTAARLQVDAPEILVLNIFSEEHERPSSVQKGKVSSSPGQGHGGQGMRGRVGGESFHRKRGADVGSQEYNKISAGRPTRDRWRTPGQKERGSYRRPHAEEVRDTVIVRRRGNRLTVGCPFWSALQIERIGHNPSVCAARLHPVKKRLPVLPDGECDKASVGSDCRSPKIRAPGPLPTPFPFRWRASRHPRPCRSQKHTEDNLEPVVGRTLCWSSARFERLLTLRPVNHQSADARVSSGDVRA